MTQRAPIDTQAKSIRLPVALWRKIKAYQGKRMLSTELAATRELIEAGLSVHEPARPTRAGRG